jgi:hypothetical protein
MGYWVYATMPMQKRHHILQKTYSHHERVGACTPVHGGPIVLSGIVVTGWAVVTWPAFCSSVMRTGRR